MTHPALDLAGFTPAATMVLADVCRHSVAEPDASHARDQLAVLSLIARRLDDARELPPEWAHDGGAQTG